MQVGAIWVRWIEMLATVLFAWRETWRGRRVLIVTHENDRLIIRQVEPGRDHFIPQAVPQGLESIGSVMRKLITPRDREPCELTSNTFLSTHLSVAEDVRASGPGDTIRIDDPEKPAESILAALPAGTPVPDEVARAARGCFIILELSADKVVVPRISVPAQAREFLSGIVRNQLERLSPWPADQTVYGFDAEVSSADAAALEVRVFITSRGVVGSARDELDAIGLPVDRIVVREGDTQAAAPVTLWSRLADVPREGLERAGRQIGVAIAALVTASVVLSVWALSSAASIRADSEDLAARSRTLQRQLQGSRTPAAASLLPAERAWLLKETSPSAAIVLEVLSRALPDAAHLTELRLENTTLRIIGLAKDAPSLIAPLERSGHFADVHFSAPTTRGADGTVFKFHIEARVVPRLEVTEY